MTRAKDISKILTDADFSGTLDVTGVSTLNSKVGILGTNDLGLGLHIKEGDSGVTSVSTDADQLVIENNAESGISILAPTNSASRIAFGDSDNNKIGMIYYNHSSNFMQFEVNNAERLRIDASGNVGIGITPARKLHVGGTGSGQGELHLTNDTTGHGVGDGTTFTTSGSDLLILQRENANARFYTNGTERMRIDENGRMTISSDGQATYSTIASFEVRGQNAPLTKINHTQNADEVALQMRHDYARGSQSATMIQFLNNNGAEKGTIKTTETATSFNTSSDHRLKENVTSDWDATTRLKHLNPVRFNFISNADTTVDGFLAHEVQSVVPEAITGTHNEVKIWREHEELPDGVSVGDNKLDEDGNTIPVYQGIDKSKLVPLLAKTIQELEARITALETA